jgi:hypothetical protein
MSLIIFAVLIVCMSATASSLPHYDDYDGGYDEGFDGGFEGGFGGGYGGGFGGGYRDSVGGGYGGYGRTSEVDTIQRLPFGGFIEEDVITR